MYVRGKNGEYELATFSSFQRNIQRYFSGKKYLFNIINDNDFKEIEKSSTCEAQVTGSRAR